MTGRGLGDVLRSLEHQPVSTFLDHDAPCCRQARAWFSVMSRNADRQSAAEPAPVTRRWQWGPCAWPLWWCQAVRAPELDCGGLAHLAHVSLQESGHHVVRIQLVQRIAAGRTEHWAARWSALPGMPTWIWDDLTYHETVGVLTGSSLRLWDPVEHCWRSRTTPTELSRIVAIRVMPVGSLATRAPLVTVVWQTQALELQRWTETT